MEESVEESVDVSVEEFLEESLEESTGASAELSPVLLSAPVVPLPTKSISWEPSGMGPSGCAGQLPAGETSMFPNGLLSAPPTNSGFAPSNWH